MNIGIYFMLFVGIILPLFNAQNQRRCPNRCLCFRTTVRCMFLQLREVPPVPPDTTILDLRFNKIKSLPNGIFRNMSSLLTLLLNNNHITKLEENTFQGLNRLQHLYLYKNKIEEVSQRSFRGLPNLEQLYIHFNYIEELLPDTFSNLPRLERLFLHNNKLTSLPNGLFDNLRSLRRLRLDSNALICDCKIMWLNAMLKENPGTEAAATCGEPTTIRGRDLITIDPSELHCAKPEFTERPQDAEVSVGHTAYFHCKANGEPTPEIKWMHNGVEISHNDVARGNRYNILDDGTLRIEDAQDVDQGTYECVAQNDMGAVTAEAVQLRYQGDLAEARFLRRPDDFTVIVGESIALECRAAGHPRPTISWSKDNRPIPDDRRFNLINSGSLVISNIQYNDRGKYRCTATNSQNTISATARVLIQVPPTFAVRPSDLSLVEGGEAVFTCRATGQPRPVITWLVGGRPLQSRHYRVSGNGVTLRFSDVNDEDVGTVECQAENNAGLIRSSATLVLKPKTAPRITSEPQNIRVPEGVTAEMICEVSGDPTPSITWVKDGRPLTLGDKYTIQEGKLIVTEVSRSDQGRYTCLAQNEVGSNVATANLTVLDERRPFPGDRFLNESFRRATEEVNQAINQTQSTFADKKRRKTPGDLLALFRYPSANVIPLSRAWEVFERTLEVIIENAKDGHMVNISDEADYRDLVSPSHLAVLANLSGCAAHRRVVDCNRMCYHHKYRTMDGTCNNLLHPMWGASLIQLKRLRPAQYENGFNTPVGWNQTKLYKGFLKPSARKISTRMFATGSITPDEKLTHMLMQWGQFIDHDLDFTPMAVSFARFSDGRACNETCDNEAPCFPIPIPRNDPRIKRHACMGVTRSSGICNSGMTSVFYKQLQTRQQVNQITSYIDGSNIYGSSDEEVNHLRALHDRRGLMRIGLVMPSGKGLLPPNDIDAPVDCQIDPHQSHVPCFLAGDHRANEQLGLLSMHTLWLREHNRVARTLFNFNPHWDKDMIFYEARKIVGAQLQHITYTHWLPKILGEDGMAKIGEYKGYKPDVDSSVSNEFATAAFRFGHSLINPVLNRFNSSYKPIPQGNLALHRAFFAPWRIVEEGGIDPVLRGLIGSSAKKLVPGEFFNLELTEKLFKLAHEVALDLAALNIQRGRDHGLPSYNEYRKLCGLEPAETFEELSDEITDLGDRLKMQELYGHPDNVDLFVGGLAETPLNGAKIGPTFVCIIADQFKRSRDGDRFWYENPGVFEPSQLTQIRMTTLAKLLCDNADNITQAQKDVFHVADFPEGLTKCDKIPEMDLKVWTHCCHDCSRSGEFESITSHFGRRLTNRFSHLNRRGDQALPRIQPVDNSPPQRDRSAPNFNAISTEPDTPPIFEGQEQRFDNQSTARRQNVATVKDVELLDIRLDSMEDLVEHLKKTIRYMKRRIKKLEDRMEEVEDINGEIEDCIDGNGRIFKDGQKWNVGECRKCKCELGQIECDKETCPSLACDTPKNKPGQCCPVC